MKTIALVVALSLSSFVSPQSASADGSGNCSGRAIEQPDTPSLPTTPKIVAITTAVSYPRPRLNGLLVVAVAVVLLNNLMSRPYRHARRYWRLLQLRPTNARASTARRW
jgi:hypothetical protein